MPINKKYAPEERKIKRKKKITRTMKGGERVSLPKKKGKPRKTNRVRKK